VLTASQIKRTARASGVFTTALNIRPMTHELPLRCANPRPEKNGSCRPLAPQNSQSKGVGSFPFLHQGIMNCFVVSIILYWYYSQSFLPTILSSTERRVRFRCLNLMSEGKEPFEIHWRFIFGLMLLRFGGLKVLGVLVGRFDSNTHVGWGPRRALEWRVFFINHN